MMKKNFTYNVNSYHPMPQIMFIPANIPIIHVVRQN